MSGDTCVCDGTGYFSRRTGKPCTKDAVDLDPRACLDCLGTGTPVPSFAARHTCVEDNAPWACDACPKDDDPHAAELAHLRADNARLARERDEANARAEAIQSEVEDLREGIRDANEKAARHRTERDEARAEAGHISAAAQYFVDLFDENRPIVSPSLLKIVARAVRDSHATLRTENAALREELDGLRRYRKAYAAYRAVADAARDVRTAFAAFRVDRDAGWVAQLDAAEDRLDLALRTLDGADGKGE